MRIRIRDGKFWIRDKYPGSTTLITMEELKEEDHINKLSFNACARASKHKDSKGGGGLNQI
jgi:hypothetical protein